MEYISQNHDIKNSSLMDEFPLPLLSVPRESRTIGKILVLITIFEAVKRKMSFRDLVYSEQKYDHDVHQ